MSRDRLTYAQVMELASHDYYTMRSTWVDNLAGWWRHKKRHGVWTPVAEVVLVGWGESCAVDMNGRRWKVVGGGYGCLFLRRAWGWDVAVGHFWEIRKDALRRTKMARLQQNYMVKMRILQQNEGRRE